MWLTRVGRGEGGGRHSERESAWVYPTRRPQSVGPEPGRHDAAPLGSSPGWRQEVNPSGRSQSRAREVRRAGPAYGSCEPWLTGPAGGARTGC